MAEIGINYNVFKSETGKMKASASAVKFDFSSSLSSTDIEPFHGYLQLINALKSSVEQYKSLSLTDISKIEDIGEKIKEADEKSAAIVK